jgi:hypothetical protein
VRPGQQRCSRYGPDEVVGVGVGERDDPGGAVSQCTGGGPPGSEQHERAEDLFVQHADRDLGAAGDHRLDNDGGQLFAEILLE